MMEIDIPKLSRAESDNERVARLEERARKRNADALAESEALDAAVRRSIALHGA